MSEPTDLIRAVDERHVREVIAVHEGYGEEAWCLSCKEHWPCEVRRLRDALKVSETETERAWNAHNEVQEKLFRVRRRAATYLDQASRLSDEVNRLTDALAEANATIERVEAFRRLLSCDRGSTTCEDIAGRLEYELRGRAIEGPQS